MAKNIVAKIDEYEKNGQTKGKYVDIGVILSNDNGEYIMLSPMVDLAGVVMKQRQLAIKKGKDPGNNVMCSIFDNSTPAQQQADAASEPFSGSNQGQAYSAQDDGFDSIPF